MNRHIFRDDITKGGSANAKPPSMVKPCCYISPIELPVFLTNLKVSLSVLTNGAGVGSHSRDDQVTAVAALPHDHTGLFKDGLGLHILQQLAVALLMGLLEAATPRNCSARSWKPSSSASFAIRSYISVHS